MAKEASNPGVRRSLIWVLGCLAATLALPATAAASQTFTNSAPITIKDGDCGMSTQTVALPFKSNITVAGAPTVLDDVGVVIHGLTHRYPKDIRMLLVGPGDRTVLLMHEAGGLTEVSNVTLTFDDAASGPVTEPIASGSYQPTRTEDECIVDDSALGTVSISGGWSLVIGPPDSPNPPGSGSSPGSPPITPSRHKCKKDHKHPAAASKKSCKKKK